MGRGRHALVLAELGFRVFGVDAKFEAVRDALAQASTRGLVIRGWCADLTRFPLPRARFELIVVSRYLQRDLFPSLGDALTPGGVVLFETFTEAQRGHGRGPTSPDHLLAPGELRTRFDTFEVLFYEEVAEPDAVARIVARKSGYAGTTA
jgi:SAM-dependent methyltransferase